MYKNLQRDFRDIHAEYDKLISGQRSELAKCDGFLRASVRLREIFTILSTSSQQSPLLAKQEVLLLMERLNTVTMPA
ncbi:MAG: hypothetical protein NNA18_04235 [Nitrospira sp.]|nr:hypothetical protein [Nitrospira sp.]